MVANWEVGHTQYVTSQLLHIRFQPENVRLVGLGFNKINPVVLWITPSLDVIYFYACIYVWLKSS